VFEREVACVRQQRCHPLACAVRQLQTIQQTPPPPPHVCPQVAQTKQIMAMLPPDASLRDKANAAARAALTVMVASDALTAAGDASAPNGRIKAAEADAGASSTQAEGGDVLRLRSAAAWMQHVAARVGPSLQGRR
jgi:hypothetical protein